MSAVVSKFLTKENEPAIENEVAVGKVTNDKLKWREWSKNIAYLDALIFLIGLPFSVACGFVVTTSIYSHDTSSIHLPKLEITAEEFNGRAQIARAAVAFFITILIGSMFVGLRSAFQLMSATRFDSEQDPKNALKKARNWRNGHLVLIVFTVLLMFVTQAVIACCINILWHFILLCVVQQYIYELRRMNAKSEGKVSKGSKQPKTESDDKNEETASGGSHIVIVIEKNVPEQSV